MPADLLADYRAYLDCLNRRAWDELPRFVHEGVEHNGRAFGVAGYRGMLERDVEQIPDLRFDVEMLVGDASTVAARLKFDCRPKGTFLGLDVGGRRVCFVEHAFYAFEHGLIRTVWSVIDREAIAAQIG